MLEIWLNLFVKFCFLFDDEVAPSMQKVRCESNARYIIAFPVQFLQVIAWFQSAIWKKHARVSFSKTSKQHESEGRVQFEEFEKPTSACLFQNQHEKLSYYLVIIYMTKLCRTESRICVTCKIICITNALIGWGLCFYQKIKIINQMTSPTRIFQMLLAGFFKHINFTNQAENITGL